MNKMQEMIPSYGHSLAGEAELCGRYGPRLRPCYTLPIYDQSMSTLYRTGRTFPRHSGNHSGNEVIGADSILYEEYAPPASLDWHNAPTTQYVITLAGRLGIRDARREKLHCQPGRNPRGAGHHGSGSQMATGRTISHGKGLTSHSKRAPRSTFAPTARSRIMRDREPACESMFNPIVEEAADGPRTIWSTKEPSGSKSRA